SSKCITYRAFGCAATAVASGAEREPGARQKKSTPLRTSSSTIRSHQSRVRFGDVIAGSGQVEAEDAGEVADLLLDLGPLPVGLRPLDDSGAGEECEAVPPGQAGADRHRELGAMRADPPEWPGVPAAVERLQSADRFERRRSRIAADGRCGMQRAHHVAA